MRREGFKESGSQIIDKMYSMKMPREGTRKNETMGDGEEEERGEKEKKQKQKRRRNHRCRLLAADGGSEEAPFSSWSLGEMARRATGRGSGARARSG